MASQPDGDASPASGGGRDRLPDRPWHTSYRDVPREIDPDAHSSVTALLEDAMRRYADRTAFISFGVRLTFAEVDRQSAAFCAFLQHRLGVAKGDRVAVMTPNLAAFAIAFVAIARAGATQVNVNPLYTPHELGHQLADADCKAIVVYAGSTGTLAELAPETRPAAIVTVAPGDGLGAALPAPPVDGRLANAIPFAAALEDGAGLERLPVAVTGEDLIFLQYTGGTTGLSKGAALTHRNIVANTEQFKAMMCSVIRPGDEVIVTAIPLYHIFALTVNLVAFFSLGAENWLVADPRDADGLIAIISEARPTAFTGVNTLYACLASHPRASAVDWSRLRLAVGGGAAVVETVAERWKAATGRFIRQGYGLSETSPVVSLNPDYVDAFTGSTGLPLPSTDVRLIGDDGADCALGEPGEICVNGPQVMAGYWRRPDADAEAFTEDGYFRTGDIGVFDALGFLKVVDRKKDMIIVSGFNVFPNEVEAAATACPGVAECACVGVADPVTGEAVKLFVVRAPGASPSAADVVAACRVSLAPYKAPKIVRFLDALPKSAVGKLLRRELRNLD